MDTFRRNFYGMSAVVLGAWETAAYAGVCPKITDVCRKLSWEGKALVAIYLAGAGVHLLKGSAASFLPRAA